MQNNKKRRKRNSPIKIFFRVLLLTIFTTTCVFAAGLAGYKYFTQDQITSNSGNNNSILNVLGNDNNPKENVNGLIMGVDSGGTRTDLMIIVNFSTEDYSIDMVSVPRDTYINLLPENVQILKDNDIYVPPNGAMKMTEIYHYAGEEFGTEMLVDQLEYMLEIDIPYYAKIDLESFRYIVDSMGGVDFYVPQRMYYTDPYQDLYIDLYEGQQTLNGEQAEGLIRYRKADINNPISKGYADSDGTRNKMQQDFVKAMMSQLLSKNGFVSGAMTIFQTYVKYVDTNFGVADATKYFKYLDKISMDNVNSYTLPNEPVYINDISYVQLDEEATRTLVDEVFYDKSAEEVVTDTVSLTDKTITIYNGSYRNGLASYAKNLLENDGYRINDIGNYDKTLEEYTRIYVSNPLLAEPLLTYFDDPKIIESDEFTSDVTIIIGTEETFNGEK